ncbi:MAG TPA: coenzyme F420-0:L-glutamate ligase [Tepidiformaceae bacterium]|nr:coenzyme F420-0:L-glutamate ligase [Tepidiformaceae bacterium]
MATISVSGVQGLPEVEPGSDLGSLILESAAASGTPVVDGDIVVVTSKIVSKAEGNIVELSTIEPSPFAAQYAAKWEKEPAIIELVLREARRVVRQVGPVLITETHHGFVCANSGVDQSNAGATGRAILLPVNPDASARGIRAQFRSAGIDAAVVITDTFGRPWREGQTDIAIGIAGFHPIRSYIGQVDPHGHEFHVQAICVADEVAAAAELVKGNLSRVPVAIVRGYEWETDDEATMAAVLRESERDLFR